MLHLLLEDPVTRQTRSVTDDSGNFGFLKNLFGHHTEKIEPELIYRRTEIHLNVNRQYRSILDVKVKLETTNLILETLSKVIFSTKNLQKTVNYEELLIFFLLIKFSLRMFC